MDRKPQVFPTQEQRETYQSIVERWAAAGQDDTLICLDANQQEENRLFLWRSDVEYGRRNGKNSPRRIEAPTNET